MEHTERRQLTVTGVDATSEDTDAALIGAAKAGDATAQRRLYVIYAPPVYRFARGFLRDQHDAEQATQETFAAVFADLNGYKSQRGTFRTWVLGIARHRCLHLERTRRRWWKRVFSIEQAHAASGFDLPDATDLDLSLDLLAALARLDPMSRAIILLIDIQGYSYAEVAVIVGCAAGTVGPRRSRALQKLREELGDRS